jgi:hypothetical protein
MLGLAHRLGFKSHREVEDPSCVRVELAMRADAPAG